MALISSTNVTRQDGNGVSTVFAYSFKIFDASHLFVYVNGVLKTINTDYIVDGVGVATGGNVTFVVAPGSGTGNVVLVRTVPYTQISTYPEGSKFPSQQVSNDLDLRAMAEQQLHEFDGRALNIPVTDNGIVTELPAAASRANKYLAFDANGQPIMSSATSSTLTPVSAFIETLLDDVDAATARTTLGAAALASPAFTGTPSLPTGTTGVTQALGDNSTKIADTAFVQQELTSKPRIPVRQTVLVGSVDTSGLANWVVSGTGLTINYNATATAVVLTMANGYDASGEVDFLTRLTVDATNQFGAIPANSYAFLYADYLTNSSITGANINVPPMYGEVFDQKQNVLLHFDGADAAVATTDDYGNSWSFAGNAQLDTAQAKIGASSLLLDGTGDYAEWAPALPATFTQQGYGWTIEGYVRYNVLPTAGQHMTLFNFGQAATLFGVNLHLFNNAGTTKLEVSLSSNGTSHDIANGTVGTSTTWATNTWYHMALVFDPIAGKYFVYKDGVQDISVTSSVNVCQLIKLRLGRTIDNTLTETNGWIDEVRFSPCVRYPNGTTFTPSVVAFTVGGHFFSIPEMKMYEITSASGSAGVNPTMTNRPARVFVGECQAAVASITSTTSYAYRGRVVTLDAAFPGLNTKTSYTVNLGLFSIQPGIFYARCYTAEAGYTPGQTGALESHHGTYSFPMLVQQDSRNVVTTMTSGSSSSLTSKTSGNTSPLTAGNWKTFIAIQRGW
jgi:hypothetical protein